MALATRRFALPILLTLALAGTACGAHGGGAKPQSPVSQATVTKAAGPEAAPEEAKTVTVEYAFDRDAVNKNVEKTFTDGFERKGLKIDETLTAHAHFDVKDAKISGTVTYIKSGTGDYSILEADLVATGHYDADVQVDLDVQIQGDTKNAKDGDWDKMIMGGRPVALIKNVMPTSIPIAGPLSLHAHFDLSAACDMELDGQMHATTGVGIAGDVHLGAKYKKAGFEPLTPDGKRPKFQFEAKAPSFELAPKPYLEVKGGKQRVKGRCSLQPTAVILVEDSIGAKLSVEPFVDLDAKRASARDKWTLETQGGVSVNAATDIAFFGRHVHKPTELPLYGMMLSKPEDDMARTTGKIAKLEVASVLDSGLGAGKAAPAPVSTKPSMRGRFGKKKKL